MRVTIAHYRKVTVLIKSLGLGVFLILLYIFSFLPAKGDGNFFESIMKHKMMLPVGILGWVGGLVGFWIISLMLKSILFQRGSVLWIENGKLVFLNRWNFSIPCGDIVEMKRDTSGLTERSRIVFLLRDGAEKSLLTGSLIEPPDVILARLGECIPSAVVRSQKIF